MQNAGWLHSFDVSFSACGYGVLWYNNFAMLGNGLKWSFPNICVTNLLLVEWKFIISTRE